MTEFGWDASDYDWDPSRGPMDLKAAKQAGIMFFSHKSTELSPEELYTHDNYGEAMERARDAGIEFLAAYVVPRSGVRVDEQVDTFLTYIDKHTPWWRSFPGFFLQTDLEHWAYNAVQDEVGETMVRSLRTLTQKTVFLYASKGHYGDSIDADMIKWNANYAPEHAPTRDFRDIYRGVGGDNGPGWESYSGAAPVIWQYASDATIGRQTTCDANAFRGTVDDFRKLIEPNVPTVALTPEQLVYNQAFNAGWNAAYNKAFQLGFTAGRNARHGGT